MNSKFITAEALYFSFFTKEFSQALFIKLDHYQLSADLISKPLATLLALIELYQNYLQIVGADKELSIILSSIRRPYAERLESRCADYSNFINYMQQFDMKKEQEKIDGILKQGMGL